MDLHRTVEHPAGAGRPSTRKSSAEKPHSVAKAEDESESGCPGDECECRRCSRVLRH